MTFRYWETPIKSSGGRTLELVDLQFNRSGLNLVLSQENCEVGGASKWTLSFDSVIAAKITTEECSGLILLDLPSDDCDFFRSESSKWLYALGLGQIDFLKNNSHIVICCCDEIVEIVTDIERSNFSRL